MRETAILNLRSMVADGELFRSPADEHRIEAFIPPMGRENHAANMVELPNGDLLCVWFSGSEEGRSDVRIVMSRLSSGGAQWSRAVVLSEDPSRSEQNPMLFLAPKGKLWLFYTAQETRECSKAEWSRRVTAGEAEGSYAMQWTAVIRCRVSDDNGATWGAVQTFSSKPSSFCRQPMLVLSNGDWLFPMYYSVRALRHANDYSVIQISGDQGATWVKYPVPESRGRVHPSVIELAHGRLAAFFRSRAADRIYLSRSEDYGRTWTVPERTMLPNNNASIQAIKLASGNIAMIFNNVSSDDDDSTKSLWLRQRYPVTVAISEDAGNTWPYMRHIDTSDDFCGEQNEHLNRRCEYPCLLQTQDGMLHIAYSYRDRQCMKYVRVSEDWVRNGFFEGDGSAYFKELFG
jgi:predicted neuraminidase